MPFKRAKLLSKGAVMWICNLKLCRGTISNTFILAAIIMLGLAAMPAQAKVHEMPTAPEFTNAIGMKFMRIEPGTCEMGQPMKQLPSEILPSLESGYGGGYLDLLANGDFDEKPAHTVKISNPFYMGSFEVTNFQYELFEPEHKLLRGKNGISNGDNEAVVFVNWYQAKAFCDWLSEKENLPYRLPTEAEWEYACRAGTTTNFYTGDILPKEFLDKSEKQLDVGKTTPNSWGLYDMHGNVEEWCQDWYGPYVDGFAIDPVGYTEGNIRVARGGSHSTGAYYLRSANRMGTVPEDKHWIIGLRVVIGEMPKTKPLPMPPKPLCQQNVIQRSPAVISKGPDPDKPYFKGPRKYVNIPRDAIGPLFAGHNHSPSIVACPNGDLFATWFSGVTERGRDMTVAGTRFRYDQEQWDPASLFWDGPDRNDVAPGMWCDENGKIYWATGLSAGANYGQSASVQMTSTDSGETWSRARLMGFGHMSGFVPNSVSFKLNDGTLVGNGFIRMLLSRDNGLTWADPGGHVRGGHICAVQLKDGKFFILTREEEVDGMMAISSSDDLGKSYTYKASIFPPIGGGQSPAMLRLKEGPIFFASFAGRANGITITDASGAKRAVRGMFAAVSEDEGKTWSNIRLVSDDGPGRSGTTTNGGCFAMSQSNAEYQGYMAACQSADGVIHLISSYSHYSFNLKWLKTPPPPLGYPPIKVQQVVETFTGPELDAKGWEPIHGYSGGFNGKGQLTMIAKSHFQGLNRLLGVGSFEMNITLSNIHYNQRSKTASPGFTVSIKDEMARRLHFNIRDDRIDMIMFVGDGVKSAPFPEGPQYNITYSTPPTAAQLKFVYSQVTRRMRVFYGLNGAEAATELPQSKVGVYFAEPLSESTAAYIMMSTGQVDLDYFEIKPLSDETTF
ncbi:MAG: hypothetical protein E4H40_00345 [Candidatus Brocadiia bacterium]|nr:MAG: hypothetical protein E4H40_00345 [Candidatus Brocadiia bacterium]